MNRAEFMSKLAALLQNLSVEEREEAMQFYNNYFDDAGEENEAQVITELGSPEKVAATIKAGLSGDSDETCEYRETGYTDTRFEEKDAPAKRGATGYRPEGDAPKTSTPVKILLVILIIIVGAPIALPIGLGIFGTIIGILFAVFGIIFGIVIASVVIAVVGIVLFVIGLTQIFSAAPAALALMGSGLLIFVLGMIATVLTAKLCMMIIPPLCRGIVNICRKPFHRKAVNV